jgi:hypothetical protein
MTGQTRAARVPRLLQSAAAAALLADLRARTGISNGPSSKAHSRSLMAAALSRGRIGVDVEYRAPGRRIGAVAALLMGSDPEDDHAAYRVFTFRESYFKAFGDWPGRDLLRVAASAAEPGAWSARDMKVRHERIGDDFALTLVWTDAP